MSNASVSKADCCTAGSLERCCMIQQIGPCGTLATLATSFKCSAAARRPQQCPPFLIAGRAAPGNERRARRTWCGLEGVMQARDRGPQCKVLDVREL